MRNKRASLSTFIFVLMVIMVCFSCIILFAKHRAISDREMIVLDPVVKSTFQEEVAYIQLKMFSEEAIFYAYNQTLFEYGFDLKLLNEKSYKFFDYNRIQKNNFTSKQIYRSRFKELVQNRYNYLVSKYPNYTSSDLEIFSALKNAVFGFDGENISAVTQLKVSKEESGIKILYMKKIEYGSSLGQFGLISLENVSQTLDICQYSLDKSFTEKCLLSLFSSFEFEKSFSGIQPAVMDKGEFNMAKLVSKTGYFVGSVGAGESEVVHPSIYLVLPSSSNEEYRVRALFPNAVSSDSVLNGIGSSFIVN